MPDATESAARRLKGACLCGAVEYSVADAFVYAANCHCSQCRRATGSAFKPFAGIAREKLSLTKGADAVMTYGDDQGHDVHCGRCGSLLYHMHALSVFFEDYAAENETQRRCIVISPMPAQLSTSHICGNPL